MKAWIWLAVAAAVVASAMCMTMTQREGAEVPDELKPILPGGSWFDDMAIKRLRSRHRELKEIGGHEDDSEEQFIMSRLKDPEIVLLEDSESHEVPIKAPLKTQDTREALRSFLRQHTRRNLDGEDSLEGHGSSITTSREFMDIYEKELQKFFKNFMSVMLQAEIGGVSIENRSEEERKDVEAFADEKRGDHAGSNDVTPP